MEKERKEMGRRCTNSSFQENISSQPSYKFKNDFPQGKEASDEVCESINVADQTI